MFCLSGHGCLRQGPSSKDVECRNIVTQHLLILFPRILKTYVEDRHHSFVFKYFCNIFSMPDAALGTSQVRSQGLLMPVLGGWYYYPYLGVRNLKQRSYETCRRNMCTRLFFYLVTVTFIVPHGLSSANG